jgi:hypothetical protein
VSEPPPDFTGDLEGYLRWREENPAPFNPLWCARHWAPCPVEKKNGIVASLILTRRQIDGMPRAVRRGGPTAMNSWQANQTTPLCCRLGDDEMAKVWEEAST